MSVTETPLAEAAEQLKPLKVPKEKKSKKSKDKKKKKKSKKSSKKRKNSDEETQTDSKRAKPDSTLDSSAEDFRKKHAIALTTPAGFTDDNDAKLLPSQTFKAAQALFDESCEPLFSRFLNQFEAPTPVQAQVWPILCNYPDNDLIGVAETGSGKTLAFSLPFLAKILSSKTHKNTNQYAVQPRCLIIAPTRELAIQSWKVLEEVKTKLKTEFAAVKNVAIYGGTPRWKQQGELKEVSGNCGTEVVLVATVGRLLDFMESGEIDLSFVEYLVLDEADRMLDMGFEQEVKKIIKATTQDLRRTLMFSATWPEEIRKIASKYMKSPIRVTIGSESLSANHRVSQTVMVMEPFAKDRKLTNLLHTLQKQKRSQRIIVFALYKKECARLEGTLQRQGFKAVALHGDKTQSDREESLDRFLRGECDILVATDVASRGLDIKGVGVVINNTFPLTIEDYVHRIGRTGRSGEVGESFTFFTSHEKHLAGALQNVLRQNGEDVPDELKKFGNTVKKKVHGMYGAHARKSEDMENMGKSKHIKF